MFFNSCALEGLGRETGAAPRGLRREAALAGGPRGKGGWERGEGGGERRHADPHPYPIARQQPRTRLALQRNHEGRGDWIERARKEGGGGRGGRGGVMSLILPHLASTGRGARPAPIGVAGRGGWIGRAWRGGGAGVQ